MLALERSFGLGKDVVTLIWRKLHESWTSALIAEYHGCVIPYPSREEEWYILRTQPNSKCYNYRVRWEPGLVRDKYAEIVATLPQNY